MRRSLPPLRTSSHSAEYWRRRGRLPEPGFGLSAVSSGVRSFRTTPSDTSGLDQRPSGSFALLDGIRET